MATYSYGHRKATSTSSVVPASPSGNRPVLARVVDIVLNEEHKDYKNFGKDKSINGIRYRTLTSTVVQGDEQFVRDQLPFAYQDDTNIKRIPLIGEIVEIASQSFSDKAFYSFPKNVNNSTLANITPDLLNEDYIGLGENEIQNIRRAKQLESIKGDVIIEGRSGQSIRMSSYPSTRSPFVDSTSQGNPILIIRNGQGEETESTTIFESINIDDVSLYLTSKHVIPLNEASTKRDSYKQAPDNAKTYRGKQLIGNADRVFLNARTDHALISGKKSVGLNGESVNLDGSDYVSLDASKIYLGKESKKEKEEAVLGQKLTDVLNDVVSMLRETSAALKLAAPNAVALQIVLLSVAGTFDSHVTTLGSLIPQIKSKKVFVE